MSLYYQKQHIHDEKIVQLLATVFSHLNAIIPLISTSLLCEQTMIWVLMHRYRFVPEDFSRPPILTDEELPLLRSQLLTNTTPIPVTIFNQDELTQPPHCNYSRTLQAWSELQAWPTCNHLAQLLSGAQNTEWQQIQKLRHLNHAPISAASSILPAALFKKIQTMLDKNTPLSQAFDLSPVEFQPKDHAFIQSLLNAHPNIPKQCITTILCATHPILQFCALHHWDRKSIHLHARVPVSTQDLLPNLPFSTVGFEKINRILSLILQEATIHIPKKSSPPYQHPHYLSEIAPIPLQEEEKTTSTYGLLQHEKCPFHYFTEKRLRITPKPDENSQNAMRMGRIVHFVLEHLPESAPPDMADYLKTTLPTCKDFQSLSPPIKPIVQERLQKLMTDWLDIEARRPSFRIIARELATTYFAHGITVKGRIDRMDIIDEQSHILIDYKTSPSSLDWYQDKLSQLPIYSLMLPHVTGLALGIIHPSGVKLHGHCHQDMDHFPLTPIHTTSRQYATQDTWNAQLHLWKTQVHERLKHMASGLIDPTPAPQTCQSCHHASFCRYKQRLACS